MAAALGGDHQPPELQESRINGHGEWRPKRCLHRGGEAQHNDEWVLIEGGNRRWKARAELEFTVGAVTVSAGFSGDGYRSSGPGVPLVPANTSVLPGSQAGDDDGTASLSSAGCAVHAKGAESQAGPLSPGRPCKSVYQLH